ncbi:MAG TPA: SRPBCC family protein [Ignavibacteriales bacterium]|nr:SRPBCC family protein [Ignavibacteriales bacterium]
MKEIMVAKSVVIDMPPEEVFGFVSNYNNDHVWRKDVVVMRFPEGKKPEAGDEVSGIIKLMGRERKTAAFITEYEEDKLIAFEVAKGPMHIRGYRLVSCINGSAKFTYSITIRFNGYMGFFSRLLIKNFSANIESNLTELKKVLETRRQPKEA